MAPGERERADSLFVDCGDTPSDRARGMRASGLSFLTPADTRIPPAWNENIVANAKFGKIKNQIKKDTPSPADGGRAIHRGTCGSPYGFYCIQRSVEKSLAFWVCSFDGRNVLSDNRGVCPCGCW
jgi:hypothetical protein